MQAIRLRTIVTASRRLDLLLPPEVPEGEVEVIILATAPTGQSTEHRRTLREFNDWLVNQPGSGRSKQDIDRYLAEERASWE